MKIIKHGKFYDGPQKFECENCECVFEAEDGEYEKFGFVGIEEKNCICPECGHNIYIKHKRK